MDRSSGQPSPTTRERRTPAIHHVRANGSAQALASPSGSTFHQPVTLLSIPRPQPPVSTTTLSVSSTHTDSTIRSSGTSPTEASSPIEDEGFSHILRRFAEMKKAAKPVKPIRKRFFVSSPPAEPDEEGQKSSPARFRFFVTPPESGETTLPRQFTTGINLEDTTQDHIRFLADSPSAFGNIAHLHALKRSSASPIRQRSPTPTATTRLLDTVPRQELQRVLFEASTGLRATPIVESVRSYFQAQDRSDALDETVTSRTRELDMPLTEATSSGEIAKTSQGDLKFIPYPQPGVSDGDIRVRRCPSGNEKKAATERKQTATPQALRALERSPHRSSHQDRMRRPTEGDRQAETATGSQISSRQQNSPRVPSETTEDEIITELPEEEPNPDVTAQGFNVPRRIEETPSQSRRQEIPRMRIQSPSRRKQSPSWETKSPTRSPLSGRHLISPSNHLRPPVVLQGNSPVSLSSRYESSEEDSGISDEFKSSEEGDVSEEYVAPTPIYRRIEMDDSAEETPTGESAIQRLNRIKKFVFHSYEKQKVRDFYERKRKLVPSTKDRSIDFSGISRLSVSTVKSSVNGEEFVDEMSRTVDPAVTEEPSDAELARAMRNLGKAEAISHLREAVAVAEIAASAAPPQLAEEAAAAAARDYQMRLLDEFSETVKEKSGPNDVPKTVNVVGYIGITIPRGIPWNIDHQQPLRSATTTVGNA